MKIEESSVSTKSNRNAVIAFIFEILSFLFFLIFLLAAIYGIFVAPALFLFDIPVIAISFLLRFLSTRANVSFDYIICDGTFQIGKVINNRKRKQIYELCAQDIIRVDVVMEQTKGRTDKKTVLCTANAYPPDGKVFACLEIRESIIIIEAGKKLLERLKNRSFY